MTLILLLRNRTPTPSPVAPIVTGGRIDSRSGLNLWAARHRRFWRVVILGLGLGALSQMACGELTGPSPAPAFILDDPGETTQPPTSGPSCPPGYLIWWVFETRADGTQVAPWWFCGPSLW